MGKVCVRILYLSSLEKSLFKPRGIVWKPPKKQNYPTNKPTTYVFSTSVTTLTGYSVWVSFSEIVANTINRVANTINRVLQELPWEKNKIIVIIKYFSSILFPVDLAYKFSRHLETFFFRVHQCFIGQMESLPAKKHSVRAGMTLLPFQHSTAILNLYSCPKHRFP